MDTGRSFQLLTSLSELDDPGASDEETGQLRQLGLVEEATPEQRTGFSAAAANLERARSSVRSFRRALDLAWGPRTGPPATSGPTSLSGAQLSLRTAIDELEECSLAQARWKAQVPNATTGTFLTLTLGGRQTLADLAAWRSRFDHEDLFQFTGRIGQLRESCSRRVGTAARLSEELEWLDKTHTLHWGPAAARACSLFLGFQRRDLPVPEDVAESLYHLYSQVAHREASPVDRLLMATLLTSGDTRLDRVQPDFEDLCRALASVAPFSAASSVQVDLLAASLADLGPWENADLVRRSAEMATVTGSADPLGVSALARAGLSPAAAAVRVRDALRGFQKLGYDAADAVPSAACVLAASAVANTEFESRLSALDPFARGIFPSAPMAAGLLASLPLTPGQAMLLHKYCVAEVSKSRFFTETAEVDYLALLLVLGVASSDQTFWSPELSAPADLQRIYPNTNAGELGPLGRSFSSQSTGSPLPSAGAGGVLVLPALFANHGYWLYRSYLDYARQHPVHTNAVPIYG